MISLLKQLSAKIREPRRRGRCRALVVNCEEVEAPRGLSTLMGAVSNEVATTTQNDASAVNAYLGEQDASLSQSVSHNQNATSGASSFSGMSVNANSSQSASRDNSGQSLNSGAFPQGDSARGGFWSPNNNSSPPRDLQQQTGPGGNPAFDGSSNGRPDAPNPDQTDGRPPHPPHPPGTVVQDCDDSIATSTDSTLAATTASMYSLLSQSSDDRSIQTSAETAVNHYWQQDFEGFIEFPRPISAADIRSGNSLQEHPEALENPNQVDRHSTELYQSEGLDLNIDSSDDGASIAAAIEFFNQQTAGGFVDAGLDALNDNTQFAVIPAGGYRNGLEASIGRVNPFDDGRYTAMLTTIQSQTEGDSHTSHVGENAATPNMTMVGLVFGVVSVRSRAFGQFVETFRRLTKRLGMLLTGRTKW